MYISPPVHRRVLMGMRGNYNVTSTLGSSALGQLLLVRSTAGNSDTEYAARLVSKREIFSEVEMKVETYKGLAHENLLGLVEAFWCGS